MTQVWKHLQGSSTALLVALALADVADHHGEKIFPSVTVLIRKTRLSRRCIQYQLRQLRAQGWLQIIRRPQGGHRTMRYRINPQWIAETKIIARAPGAREGRTTCTGGVHDVHPRGAPRAPLPIHPLIHPLTVPDPGKTPKKATTPEETETRRRKLTEQVAALTARKTAHGKN